MNKDTLKLTPQSHKDIARLQKVSVKLLGKILLLIADIMEHPFEGKGKPEPLKGDLAGCWSRRIDQKHRLIYKVEDEFVIIISCYGHYDDK